MIFKELVDVAPSARDQLDTRPGTEDLMEMRLTREAKKLGFIPVDFNMKSEPIHVPPPISITEAY